MMTHQVKNIEILLHIDDTKTIILPDNLTEEQGEELASIIANADLFS